MIHRINVFLLSFIISISPIFLIHSAFAATTPLDTPMRGWNITSGIAQGASTLYQATKNALINGKNVQKTSSVLVAPVPAKVIKVLVEGGAFLALSVAVDQLLGAVDWVLDPANNQIVYTEEDPLNLPKLWFHTSNYTKFYSTADEGCRSFLSKSDLDAGWKYSRTFVNGDSATCYVFSPNSTKEMVNTGLSHVANPNYDSTKEKEKKTLPLSTVAEQVISNAESGDTAAQSITGAAVAQTIQEAETDSVKASPIVQQLEANAVTPTSETATGTATQTDTKTDPTTGETTTETKATDIALDFPVFCTWAPSVCEAAQIVVDTPALVKEWVKTETPIQTDTSVQIEEIKEPETNKTNYLQWNAYCPFHAESSSIEINGQSSQLTSDLTSWCTFASDIKPFVLAAGAIASFLIVAGVGGRE